MSKRILVIGSSNTDMTVKVDRLPAPGETVGGGVLTMGAGGKGANQAVAAKRLGGDVTFICKVGNDLFGDNSIKNYEKEGLDTTHIFRSKLPSGVALINVDAAGENCIAVAGGANGDLTVEDIESVADVIKSSDIVMFQLETPVNAILRAAKIAHDAGCYVILNPAPACELPAEIFRYISLIIPNQTESSFLTGIEVNDAASAEKAALKFREMGVEEIIITMGSKGAMGFSRDEIFLAPAHKVKTVDTTAAGDTFCGAVAVGIVEGKTLREAALFATSASALTVQKMGAQDSIPYRKDM